MDWVKKAVDNALEKMSKEKILMKVPGDIPPEMLDETIEQTDDWKGWRPINSIITDEDIQRFEKKIGLNLPLSYKEYLKYKHFYNLQIPDQAVRLFKHLPDKNLKELNYRIFDLHQPELIIGRQYIYIADFNDYGLLCFDGNDIVKDNEYRIVYLDYIDAEIGGIHEYADNFRNLMESDSEKGNNFIDWLNEYYK